MDSKWGVVVLASIFALFLSASASQSQESWGAMDIEEGYSIEQPPAGSEQLESVEKPEVEKLVGPEMMKPESEEKERPKMLEEWREFYPFETQRWDG